MSFTRQVRNLFEEIAKIQAVELPQQQKHGNQEAEVADAVHDKGLLAGVRGRILQEEKSDEEIRSEPHALPAYKQQQVAGGQDQHQHEEHEKVEIAEEAVIAT